MSERVPEFSYRSADVYYEVHLPSWATRRRKELSVALAGADEDSIVRVGLYRFPAAPTPEAFKEKLAGYRWWDETISLESRVGTIDGMLAVYERSAGRKIKRHGAPEEIAYDGLCLDLGTDGDQHVFAFVTVFARIEAAEGLPDLWELISRFFCGDSPQPAGEARCCLRSLGFVVPEGWSVDTGSVVQGVEDFGPKVPSQWGGEETEDGYRCEWWVSGPVANDSQVPEQGEPIPPWLVRSMEGKRVIGWTVTEKEAVAFPSPGEIEGIELSDSRNRPRSKTISVWCELGPGMWVRITLMVEEKLFSRMADLLGEVGESVRIDSV